MRRAALALAAALVASLALAVPDAYAAPTLDLSARCLPSGETTLVRFHVRDQTGPTEVVLSSGPAQTGTLPSSDSPSYSGNAEVRPTGGGELKFQVQPRGGGTANSSTPVGVGGCPTLSTNGGCIPERTVTELPIRGQGFPDGEIAVYFDRLGESQTQGKTGGPDFEGALRVVPRQTGTYFVTAVPAGSSAKTVSTTVQACARPPDTTAPPATPPPPTAPAPTVVVVPPPPAPGGPAAPRPPIRVPSAPSAPIPVARTATMTLDPALGPPGSTTRVTGAGFPAGVVLNLRWVPGNGLFTVRVGSDGRFQTDVLVMRKDQTGPRVLEVVGATSPVRASYLVVRETGGWDESVFVG